MNRRTYLGTCAGAGLLALAGCLETVGSRVARTEARPAFRPRLPGGGGGACVDGDVCQTPHLVRALDETIDTGNPALGTLQVRGWLTGSQLRAQGYNSSRSNKPSTEQSPDGDGEDDGTDDTRANNHNTTRSNRTQPVSDEGDGSDERIDLERAFDHLDEDDDGDGVIVGETFVVTAPVLSLPGVPEPSADTGQVDYVKNMVSGARSASPTSEETVLRDLTTPTQVERCCKRMDKATPLIYMSTPDDGDGSMGDAWAETSLRGETDAPDQTAPAVGRAVATLDGGVRLPVLVWSQHLVHEGDHLFVAGWVLDEARLYGNAATVLTGTARTPVAAVDFDPDEIAAAARSGDASTISWDELEGVDPGGQPVRNQAGEEPCPGEDHCGLGSADVADAMLAAARDARRPDTGDGDWMGLFVVPMDAPLAHGRIIIKEVGKK